MARSDLVPMAPAFKKVTDFLVKSHGKSERQRKKVEKAQAAAAAYTSGAGSALGSHLNVPSEGGSATLIKTSSFPVNPFHSNPIGLLAKKTTARRQRPKSSAHPGLKPALQSRS